MFRYLFNVVDNELRTCQNGNKGRLRTILQNCPELNIVPRHNLPEEGSDKTTTNRQEDEKEGVAFAEREGPRPLKRGRGDGRRRRGRRRQNHRSSSLLVPLLHPLKCMARSVFKYARHGASQRGALLKRATSLHRE